MPTADKKIVTREALVSIRATLHSQGKRVGLVSGAFDFLQSRHIARLEEAASRCDVLMVGVASDAAVAATWGAPFPVCKDTDRIFLVAALEVASFAFIYDEADDQKSRELLRPNVYLSNLDEAAETRAVIGRITGSPARDLSQNIGLPLSPRLPAVFLDRDGTINENVEYLHEPEKLKLYPGVLDAIRKFKALGYRIVIVTNQAGIGLGYFTKEDLFAVNRELMRQMSRAGVSVDRIYFCPHSVAEECSCRKPRTALIERAARDLNLDISKSVVIGDMTGDIQLGKNAGCKTILVRTGTGGADKLHPVAADFEVPDLASAAELVATWPKPTSSNDVSK